MRKVVRAILIVTCIPLISVGLTVAFRYADAHWLGRVPILECPRTLDLGEWYSGETAIGHFRIKNTGNAALIAKEFVTSCSCAGVEHEVDGQLHRLTSIQLSPGDEVQLTVRVGVGVRPGESQKVQVGFATNDPVHSTWLMEAVIPHVKGGYFPQPGAVVFDPLSVGARSKQTIDLYDNGAPGRRVERVRSTHPDRFTVKLLPLSVEDKQRRHQTGGNLFARIAVTPCSKHPGLIDGEIHVTLVKESHPTKPISVVGEVVTSVVCRPAILVLTRRERDQSIRGGNVLLYHRSEKSIDVAIGSLPPGIAAEVQAVAGRSDQRCLHIEWRPTASPKRPSTTEIHLPLRVRADGEETKLEVTALLTEMRP